jgi:hypothetical protein
LGYPNQPISAAGSIPVVALDKPLRWCAFPGHHLFTYTFQGPSRRMASNY